ncbi:MAG: bifunctional [glutamate--ammonia ligase]-adenylyl-L-tyrosine phosphorylase/[glutamate--ammonia-ligase] adenylyltransferase [Moraxellaceae bacterium]|nr:bifunctional [glutamate--ammonia ligase]-adenylyl-L-tyrosine phosphorylase/[glutamate--ammonia-ligase] adenylyltransferase [Moraxellaceae bacterium]
MDLLQQHINHQLSLCAAAFTQANLSSEWLTLQQNIEPQLTQLALSSDYAINTLCQFPAQFWHMYQQGDLTQAQPRPYYHQQLTKLLADKTTDFLWMQSIRQYRQQAMLRWVYRDVNNLCTLAELTDELSEFAEASIDAAIAYAIKPLQARYGEPIGEDSNQAQKLVVIGMGKLGAQELNLSSDIDLIFSYPEAGETNGRSTLSNQEFFIKLGQQVIRLLDQATADGFVFRIDMRLRPWGDGSALALSFAAMERYYEKHGREWERYAFIKARIVAGDTQQGQELLSTLKPFVYRRYIDYSAFAALRDMKAMIEREVRRKDMANNIKLGSGGIREVEFIAQAFQLIRGGVFKDLQQRPLLPVLQVLVERQLLSAAIAQNLAQAYIFLRQVEHRIQGYQDQQTQMLPSDEMARLCLARSLGFANYSEFLTQLTQHRANVAQQFQEVVDNKSDKAQRSAGQLARELWLDICDNNQAALEKLGFVESERLEQFLQQLRLSRAVKTLPIISKERLDAFMPLLLERAGQHPQADSALMRCLPLVESVLRRTAYLVMLLENPSALQRLISLCAASPWIAAELARYPVLLDELLNAKTLFAPPQKEQLVAELRQQLLRIPHDDIEEQMRVLRIFKKSHVLRVAASDMQGTLSLMKVSDYLSWIAEAVLESVLALSWQQLTAKYGFPQRLDGSIATGDFIVLGYGKLGGLELGYGSDLDLVFVHNADSSADTNGTKAITGGEFYARLAQKIISLLTTATAAGQLYDVDMRLRPSGNAGALVSSVKAFTDYQQQHAWTWEHQALVRARVVAGDSALALTFQTVRHQILARVRDPVMLRQEVIEMRQKMREHLSSQAKQKNSPIFDIKHDAGGIVDIEFMVQYGVLAWASDYPELTHYPDNVRILESFAQCGKLTPEQAEALKAAYLEYRARSHRFALAQQPAQVPDTDFIATRTLVQQCWHSLLSPHPNPLP